MVVIRSNKTLNLRNVVLLNYEQCIEQLIWAGKLNVANGMFRTS